MSHPWLRVRERGPFMRRLVLACVLLGASAAWRPAAAQTAAATAAPEMSSMSIVAFDPDTGDVGIALASRFFAVGPIAAHVRAGVGAIATMGSSPFKDAPEMLEWLAQGASPDDVLARLRERYTDIGQINIVDARGRSASTTSPVTSSMWKGSRVGRFYAAAGNILAGPQVVAAFGDTFEGSAGKGLPLADRLLASLDAADRAGGDARGRMGATLIVKRKGAGYAGTDDLVNLRVDDSSNAINDLKRLYGRWKEVRGQVPGYRVIEQSSGDDVRWLQNALRDLGYLEASDRAVFGEDGKPLGRFNDATGRAVDRYKRDRSLGGGPSAGKETIDALARELARKGSGQ
jgi:uncharacterized Ntn-hydrolase superfamily protein